MISLTSITRRLIVLLAALFISASARAQEEARTALVVGVDKYDDLYFKELGAPVAESKVLQLKLEALGFQVQLLVNPTRRELYEATDAFGSTLARRGGVGFFYFSGHGAMKSDEAGTNYLIPTRTSIRTENDLPEEAFNAQRIANRMKEAKNRLNLIFLDACRNNALPKGDGTKSSGGGLAAMRGASGLMFFFATQPGEVAIEDAGKRSLFTSALLKHLDAPNLSFMDMMGDVTSDTESSSATLTGNRIRQSPFISGTFSGRFYFNRSATRNERGNPPPGQPVAPIAPEILKGLSERINPNLVALVTTMRPPNEDGKGSEERNRNSALGSGVIVSPEGHVITSHRAIAGVDPIIVKLNAHGPVYAAKRIGIDPGTDLAILKIEHPTKLQYLTFADSNNLKVGDTTIAIGHALAAQQPVMAGTVTSTGRGRDGHINDFIKTDTPIGAGSPGGALVDTEGRLIGILLDRSVQTTSENIGIALPANLARPVMDALIKDGKVSRGFLGISLQPMSEELTKVHKIAVGIGVLVAGVTANGPAAKGGLQTGDVVIEVGGDTISGPAQLQLAVSRFAPGSKIHVKVLRDGKEKLMNVELGERPPPKATAPK